jgi:hypothetical protein
MSTRQPKSLSEAACTTRSPAPTEAGETACDPGRTKALERVACSLRACAVLSGLLVALLAGAPVVSAQTAGWAPGRYRALIDASNQRVEQADAHEPDDPARGDLTLEAVRLRQAAASMLRDALLTGVLEQYHEHAQADYFVLEAYITEKLVELSRCDEAETQLQHALSDPLLLPVGGLAELEHLRRGIADCHRDNRPPEVAVAPTVTPDEPATDVTEQPSDATPSEPLAATPVHEPIALTQTAPPPRSPRVVPWILLGSGGALLAGALVYDLALGSSRSELDDLNSRCSTENCSAQDLERGYELVSDLDGARWLVGGLALAGLAAGVAGVVMLLLEDRPHDRGQVSLSPEGPGEIGASLRVRF